MGEEKREGGTSGVSGKNEEQQGERGGIDANEVYDAIMKGYCAQQREMGIKGGALLSLLPLELSHLVGTKNFL